MGELVKCSNFCLCKSYLPPWWKNTVGHSRCPLCETTIGCDVTVCDEPMECPICYNLEKQVKLPYCSHSICILCLTILYNQTRYIPNFPKFPLNEEKEKEYDRIIESGEDPTEFYNQYPEMYEWDQSCKKIDYEFQNRKRLQCPICRNVVKLWWEN